MRFNVYYGTEPRITDAERHNYDRGNYECAMVMKDRKDQPVIVSRSKDPSSRSGKSNAVSHALLSGVKQRQWRSVRSGTGKRKEK